MPEVLYGAVEAGGTKFVCEVTDAGGARRAHARIPTTTPAATLGSVLEFFAAHATATERYAGFGIAAFGPLDTRRGSPTYGHILATPKPGWSHTDLVGPFSRRFGCAVAIDTDVNAAALAEARDGAGRGCALVVYVTVGTGIGGGICVSGGALPMALHPEMGHISVPRHPRDQVFAGVCPFHGACLEGLASGPAIVARFGTTLDQLPVEQGAGEIIGFYLGQLAVTVMLLLSPQRIVFGGGVMSHPALLPEIRRTAAGLLKGYAGMGASSAALEDLLVAPGLGTRSGIAGALALALDAAARGH
jgi:fructokinase